jgi:3-oxoacyl-[acyl-carrier protein] reductase
MTLSLTGSTALVTGGTRGIGRGIVLALVEAGADVVTCHREETEASQSLIRELKQTGGQHEVVRADVTDPDDVDRLVTTASANGRFPLRILVHNAGAISHIPFADLPPQEWRRVLDVNLTAAYQVTQRALPVLPPGSSVVFVGSKAAGVGIPLRAHYTAAKAGLVGLARSLSKEFGGRGIRVNVVAPGIVDTSETTDVPEAMRAELAERMEQYRRRTPVGRLGTPADVGSAVLFLASDMASFVTGATLDVDGGL